MDFTITISGATYVYSAEANTFVVTQTDGTVTTLGLPTTTAAPTIEEVDVKESDGSEVVTEPAA